MQAHLRVCGRLPLHIWPFGSCWLGYGDLWRRLPYIHLPVEDVDMVGRHEPGPHEEGSRSTTDLLEIATHANRQASRVPRAGRVPAPTVAADDLAAALRGLQRLELLLLAVMNQARGLTWCADFVDDRPKARNSTPGQETTDAKTAVLDAAGVGLRPLIFAVARL